LGSSTDEENCLWVTRPSIEFKERVLIYSYSGFWAFGIISLIIADLFFYSNLILYIGFLIIPPLSSLIILIRGIYEIKKAKKVFIKITKEKLIVNLNELSLEEIARIEVKKGLLDISKLNTGTIHFYNHKNKRIQMKLEHIEQVDKVAKLLNKLILN